MKYGRNGGGIIDHNGLLYRVAQDCEIRYGDDLHLFVVDELSPLSYKEHLIKESMIPRDLTYYKEGGHQFNFVGFKGKYLVATDSKEYNSFAICRMIHKTICIFDSVFLKEKRN